MLCVAAIVGMMSVAEAASIDSKQFPCDLKDVDAPRSPLEKTGWTLTFADDFDGPRLKDRNWFTSYRAGRKDWFARLGMPSRFEDPDAHYVIEDGILKLRIDRDMPHRAKPTAPAVSSIQTSDYRIGATTNDVQRLDKFAQKYGWWEIRCRMPKGDGLHAAFWLVLADPLWQEYTLDNQRLGAVAGRSMNAKDYVVEIDIFEALGRCDNQIDFTIHFPVKLDGGKYGQFGFNPKLPYDWSRSFHVYAMEWEEGRLTWYIDGQKFWTYSGPTPQKEMQILLGQYQLGGHPKFAGWLNPTPDNLPYPRDFEIDYVRVYKKND